MPTEKLKVISGNTETYNVAVNKAEVLKTLKVQQRERPSTSVQKPSCAETFSFRHDVQQDTKKDCEYKGSVVPEISGHDSGGVNPYVPRRGTCPPNTEINYTIPLAKVQKRSMYRTSRVPDSAGVGKGWEVADRFYAGGKRSLFL